MTIKVGRDLMQGTSSKVSYYNMLADADDWVSVTKYLPLDYDLVRIKFSTGKLAWGWSVGDNWYGVLVTPDVDVVEWKRLQPDV